MRKVCETLYGIWVVAAITLKILGLVGWWVATSWFWFPVALIVITLVGIDFFVWLGDKVQARRESKIPCTCDNCLFGDVEVSPDGKCLGEILYEGHKRGEVCDKHKRIRK